MEIKVNYHGNDYRLEKTAKGDWIDLRIANTEVLHKGEFKILSLGISMELPEGYEALVIPRSSTFKHWGILQANSCGLIDNSYCGDNDIWGFPALATMDVTIEKGSRICQFRIQKKMDGVEFEETDHLKGEDRHGFGSSGIK